MAGLFYVQIDVSLIDHKKTARLAGLLSKADGRLDAEGQAVGLLPLFWMFGITHTTNGDISPFTSKAIARAVHWQGEPDELINILVEAGFVNRSDGQLVAHQWFDNCKLAARRAKRAAAKRDEREAKKKALMLGGDDEASTDEQGTFRPVGGWEGESNA